MSKPEMKHRQDPTFRGHEKHMSEFLTPETHVQQYMVFPRFLLQTDLSETERKVKAYDADLQKFQRLLCFPRCACG